MQRNVNIAEFTGCLTFVLNMLTSLTVQESAFPMTGMMLTFLCIFFITSTSSGFRPWPVGAMK